MVSRSAMMNRARAEYRAPRSARPIPSSTRLRARSATAGSSCGTGAAASSVGRRHAARAPGGARRMDRQCGGPGRPGRAGRPEGPEGPGPSSAADPRRHERRFALHGLQWALSRRLARGASDGNRCVDRELVDRSAGDRWETVELRLHHATRRHATRKGLGSVQPGDAAEQCPGECRPAGSSAPDSDKSPPVAQQDPSSCIIRDGDVGGHQLATAHASTLAAQPATCKSGSTGPGNWPDRNLEAELVRRLRIWHSRQRRTELTARGRWTSSKLDQRAAADGELQAEVSTTATPCARRHTCWIGIQVSAIVTDGIFASRLRSVLTTQRAAGVFETVAASWAADPVSSAAPSSSFVSARDACSTT